MKLTHDLQREEEQLDLCVNPILEPSILDFDFLGLSGCLVDPVFRCLGALEKGQDDDGTKYGDDDPGVDGEVR